MRAKRSKKYRKLMNQYGLTFGFREPYQVLVDANFLAALYAYKMELLPALERTLQGKVKPMLTRCTLSHLLNIQRTSAKATRTTDPATCNTTARPSHLPPPTVLPLRHCPHDPALPETSCLLSLLSNSSIPTGEDSDGERESSPPLSRKQKPNKNHYILATASPINPSSSTSREDAEMEAEALELRSLARQIPGVPILYLKRSVLILEPLSGASEGVRGGVERGKLKGGLLGKRKRGHEEEKAQVKEVNGDGGEARPGERKTKKKREYGFHKSKKDIPKVAAKSLGGVQTKEERSKRKQGDGEGDKEENERIGIPDLSATSSITKESKTGTEGTPRKRRRKHKKSSAALQGDDGGTEVVTGRDLDLSN